MSFGIDSDIIGFADTALGISLQGVSNPVKSPSEAKAMDSNGDVVAETLYDTAYGHQISLNYVCAKSSTVNLYDTATSKDFRGGKVVGGYVITGVSIGTSNKAHSTVQITAQKTISTDTEISKYNWGISFTGGKGAAKFGFTKDTVTRLVSSSCNCSVQVARSLDSAGVELAANVDEGRVDATHSLVGVTGAPGGAADTGYTLLSGPSKDEGNTAYATGSSAVFKNISKT